MLVDIAVHPKGHGFSSNASQCGLTFSTAALSFNSYTLPFGFLNEMVSRGFRIAQIHCCFRCNFPKWVNWYLQSPLLNTLAPEFMAFMIILRSTGPVISTLRSANHSGGPQLSNHFSRICFVSSRKSGSIALIQFFLNAFPPFRSSALLPLKCRSILSMN